MSSKDKKSNTFEVLHVVLYSDYKCKGSNMSFIHLELHSYKLKSKIWKSEKTYKKCQRGPHYNYLLQLIFLEPTLPLKNKIRFIRVKPKKPLSLELLKRWLTHLAYIVLNWSFLKFDAFSLLKFRHSLSNGKT